MVSHLASTYAIAELYIALPAPEPHSSRRAGARAPSRPGRRPDTGRLALHAAGAKNLPLHARRHVGVSQIAREAGALKGPRRVVRWAGGEMGCGKGLGGHGPEME